jgi:hypothetical protein
VRIRVVGFIVVIAALVGGLGASAGAAGAATVSGSLQITATTPSSVSFTVTAQRTCAADEQCDYYASIEEFDGPGDCPTTYPNDPWNEWNGNVQNTGPTTEVATITPRHWPSPGAVGPERWCLFIFADNAYYYVDGTTITRPDGAQSGGGGSGGTTNPPGGITLPGGGRTGSGGGTGTGTSGGTSGSGSSGGTRTGGSGSGTRVTVRTVALTKAAASAKAALKRAYGRKFTQGKRYKAVCRRVGRSRTHVSCAVSWQRSGTWRGTVDVTGAVRGGRQVLVTRVRVRKPKR